MVLDDINIWQVQQQQQQQPGAVGGLGPAAVGSQATNHMAKWEADEPLGIHLLSTKCKPCYNTAVD